MNSISRIVKHNLYLVCASRWRQQTLFACVKTVNIWRTRQVIKKLKTLCRFILIWCSTENKTRQRIVHGMHCPFKHRSLVIFKDYNTLGVHYRDLQARVHEQETRNLTLHEAQPSAVLNFEFLVRERVLVNPIMHEQRVLKTF